MRACFLALICLAGLATTSAQACTNKYTNFTTCRFLNGVPADGDLARIESTLMIQSSIQKNYKDDMKITHSEECWLLYSEFSCLSMPHMGGTIAIGDGPKNPVYSAPCATDGTRLKPCYKMCENLYKKCYEASDLLVESICYSIEAEKKDNNKCYGTDGVLGMKSSASLKAASWAVAPLALAVARLGMSSSF